MAKPRKPGTTRTTRAKAGARLKGGTPQSTDIEDAEVVEEKATEEKSDTGAKPRTESAATADAGGASAEAETKAPEGVDATEDMPSGIEGDPPQDPARSQGSSEPVQGGDEPPQDMSSDPAKAELLPQPVPAAPPPRSSGFGGMLLGGVIAALLGAAALYVSNVQGWVSLGNTTELQAVVDAHASEIASLKTTLGAAETRIEALAGADGAIAALNERVDGVTEVVNGVSEATVTLGAKLEATNERLDTVATEPIPEARLPEKVTNAYEAKFAEFSAALQKEQNARLAELEARLTASISDMEELQSAAKAAEQAAMEAAAKASVRAALADIEMALDTGAEYAPALSALSETGAVEVPAAIADAAGGSVATLGQLQASFPDAARAALVASTRAAADDGSVSGMTAFLRTQLGARSLEPRDGSDPDAVLSRAQAAVNGGDLQAALAEIAALPEAGKAALADWISAAETRLQTTAALAALSEQLNSN